jgi:hypothetical protein
MSQAKKGARGNSAHRDKRKPKSIKHALKNVRKRAREEQPQSLRGE